MGEPKGRRPDDRGPAGRHRVLMRDVAELAGVSVVTVSRVLNSPEKVRPSTRARARVLAAVRELDYRPNVAARVLVTGRAGVLGVVGFDDVPESPFFSPPLTTVRQNFGEVGRQAVNLLMDRIGRPAVDGVHGRRVVGPELIVRASTAALRA